MCKYLFPDLWLPSVAAYPFEAAYQSGKRLAIFDIDNTLVPHDAPADAAACRFVADLQVLGYQVALISNNGEARVRAFAAAAGIQHYVFHAGKPAPGGFFHLLEKLKLSAAHAVFFGDQLFTDIWGAKRAGIQAVLVKPVAEEKLLQIKLKRVLEKPILYAYKKRRKCDER